MNCFLCPKMCGKDRELECGYCGANNNVKIASYGLFMFEEPCLTGTKGSGAIFFSGCALKCVFCQNYEISTLNNGKEISIFELANIFKELELLGATNINLVNPTQYVLQIKKALEIYKPQIPIVYNTHGYETLQTVKFVSSFVDIFLPDLKYINSVSSEKYSGVKDYFEVSTKAIKLMRELKNDIIENEIMKQGVIVRHLVLPLHTNETCDILEWIKTNLPNTKVSLMAQYTPYGRAKEFSEINRKITKREYDKTVNKFLELELDGYVQDRTSADTMYIPKWDY